MSNIDDRNIFKKYIKKTLDHNIFTTGSNEVLLCKRLKLKSPTIDKALGGGLPRGRIIEVFGPESSGKSTFCLETCKCQLDAEPDSAVLYIDAEHALDKKYIEDGIGIDIDRFDISQPDDLKEGINVLGKAVESGLYRVIVFDSTAIKVKPDEGEIDYTGNDQGVSKEARIMSMALGKLCSVTNNKEIIVIFISQVRLDVGVRYGNPEVTTGGKALRFYTSVRLEIKKIGLEKVGTDAIANKTRIKVTKNKTAVPLREAEFNIVYGQGIDRISDLINAAVDAGVVKRAGSWYSYGDEKIGQGITQAKEFLENNPGLIEEVLEKIGE